MSTDKFEKFRAMAAYWRSLISDSNTPEVNAALKDAADFMDKLIAQKEAEQEERRAALLRQVKGLLTKTQYRRLWMYCVEGMNETRIAEAEHVGQPRICRSLRRAIKILEKNFPGRAKTGDKNG